MGFDKLLTVNGKLEWCVLSVLSGLESVSLPLLTQGLSLGAYSPPLLISSSTGESASLNLYVRGSCFLWGSAPAEDK